MAARLIATLGLALSLALVGACNNTNDSSAGTVGQGGAVKRDEVTVNGVDAVGAQTAFAVGDLDAEVSASVVLRTTDGGATWKAVLRVEGEALKDVDFADARNGLAIGEEGTLYVTQDGGDAWKVTPGIGHLTHKSDGGQKVDADTGASFNSVYFVDANTAWAGGLAYIPETAGAIPPDAPFIARTTDGGATWKAARVDGAPPAAVTRFARSGPSAGFAVAGSSDDERQGGLLKTGDGGATWSGVTTNIKQILTCVAAPTPGRIVVGGKTFVHGEDAPGGVSVSEDGGTTWRLALDAGAPIVALVFGDEAHGWAVGGTKIFATSDGGETWTEQSSRDLAGAQSVKAPQTERRIDDRVPLFSSVTLLGRDRGFAASDAGIYELRLK